MWSPDPPERKRTLCGQNVRMAFGEVNPERSICYKSMFSEFLMLVYLAYLVVDW